jgi:hypothetical protein
MFIYRLISSLRSVRLIVLAIAFPAALSCALYAQQTGGPYRDVNTWTVTFKVIIKTKCEKFCTIRSEETTEGQPDWVINYSIYREFGGAYYLGGPIVGEKMPKSSLPDSGDASTAQIKNVVQDLSKYIGWQHPGPGLAIKEPPVIHAQVKDDFDLTGKTQECKKNSYEILKTARFDRDLIVKYAFADLALDLVTEHYSVRFNILPANTGDDLNPVNVKTVQTSQSDDPSDKTNDVKTSNTKESLSSYLINSEKSIKNPDLVFRGALPQGTDEIKICRQENIKDFEYYNPAVSEDIAKNKTVVLMFALTIQKGAISLSPSKACD